VTVVDWVRVIGWSHLLQPVLTLVLATPSGVDLRRHVIPTTPLAREVMHNMAFASVGLPTALGLILALYPADVLRPGSAHAVGGLVAGFWCWRLYRQLMVLRRVWPKAGRFASVLNPVLTAIFLVQGPGLGWLLLR
jgi:hypothetical protein